MQRDIDFGRGAGGFHHLPNDHLAVGGAAGIALCEGLETFHQIGKILAARHRKAAPHNRAKAQQCSLDRGVIAPHPAPCRAEVAPHLIIRGLDPQGRLSGEGFAQANIAIELAAGGGQPGSGLCRNGLSQRRHATASWLRSRRPGSAPVSSPSR